MDEQQNIVVSLIHDFEKKVDAVSAGQDEIKEMFAGLRQDIFAAITPIQLSQIDYEKRQDADAKERIEKQGENARRFDNLQRDIRDLRFWFVCGLIVVLGSMFILAVLKRPTHPRSSSWRSAPSARRRCAALRGWWWGGWSAGGGCDEL